MPAWGTPEWHRQHPIYGTYFSKPVDDLVTELRNQLVKIRGQLGDIEHVYTGYADQLKDAQGSITLLVSYMHYMIEEMSRYKDERYKDNDRR